MWSTTRKSPHNVRRQPANSGRSSSIKSDSALRFGAFFLACVAVSPAAAQDNAVRSAVDAFGERAGIEQSGLYTETQVRGFDLNDSGGYRIDEAYFNRAANLDDTVLSGASVRVGVNAARLAYPAPSGVVAYRLREAGPANEMRLGAGFRDFGTQVLQGDGSLRAGPLSFAGGFLWRPLQRHAQGYEGAGFSIGGVAAWQITPDQRLRAFASVYERFYDGDYAVVASGGAPPPSLRTLHQYSPDWAETAATSTNVGVLYDARLGGFTLDLSAFRSIWDVYDADFTLISADAAGAATATTFRTVWARTSDSMEARLGRAFDAGTFNHLVTFSLRGGRTLTEPSTALAVPLGAFQLPDDPPDVAEVEWSGARGEDLVERATASLGYAVAWDDRLQVRFGLHRTQYDKAVRSTAGIETERTSLSTNYNASTVFNLTDRTALFGSWVTGLEESGSAPSSATNSNEVLPPGEVEQFELGVRHAVSADLTFIAAVFDVSKPSQGVRADGSFGLVGEVHHRGVEASIAGALNDRTNIVFGIVSFQSEVTGPLVDAGLVGSEGVGVSQLAAAASIDYRLSDTWSIDASLNYSGERWIDTANTFEAPAVTTLSLGTRYRFVMAGRPAQLRILASNITGEEGYLAARTGLLSPIAPRTIRAQLTLTFGQDG
jgi:iron complex outermembrane recepter protein